ncbi:MAG: hypothetical protein Q8N47_10880 [Bryobacterales bacterium]|nr:hypothetical protein [Bryobacterales bacterium]
MALRVVIALLSIAGAACADALTLRDGQVVEGTYLGGDARQVRMTVGEKVETFDLSAVAKIEFVSPLTGTAAPAPPPAAKAAGPLNGLAALIAIVAASPNVEKAPELPANPFTSLPGGAAKTPEPKPAQPNQP